MLLKAEEITRHRTTSSCWIVVDGQVYDVTPYLSQHPGGAAILLKQGGKDATSEFRKVHNSDVFQYLPEGSHLGEVDPTTLVSLPVSTPESTEEGPTASTATSVAVPTPPESVASVPATKVPHISQCVTLADFETAANAALPAKSLSYVGSYANSGLSYDANRSCWSRVRFRPRILRDVHTISTRTSMLGQDSAFPFYVSAMGSLGRSHPGGEIELVRGLARRGVHVLLSTESSQPMEEIAQGFRQEQGLPAFPSFSSSPFLSKRPAPPTVDAEKKDDDDRSPSPPPPAQLHFQLYVPADKSVARRRIRRARAAGFRSLWLTVDTVALGKRCSDRRLQAQEALDMGLEAEAEGAGFGLRAHAGQGQLNDSLTWSDLTWIREEWGADNPIVLKGVQCFEDARLAAEHGCQGILLSNHGGRQAPSAPDALTTLCEIRMYAPEVFDKLEVYVDGGCKDGSDALKALCLGAKAVGFGRPFFHALGAYGTKGVERCIDILAEELALGMKLIGLRSVVDARPELVNARPLINDLVRFEKSRL